VSAQLDAPRPHRAGRRVLMMGVAALLLLVLGLAAWIARDLLVPADTAPPPSASDPALVARGAYLARIGHCAGCHTAAGGAAYAGGRGIGTPFGSVYGSNLTPDPVHGIGTWSAEAFWRAMHLGQSRDGRLLVPVFPYTHMTHVSRADSDAIHAWLRSLPAVPQANRPHTLRFPFGTQAALAVWRALYFRPGDAQPPAGSESRSASWQRGAYLVRGLGHCSACHAQRNALGATGDALVLDGGLMSEQGWYAPSLQTDREGGVAGWPREDVVALLTTGISRRGSAQGPMAEVVHGSTQHLAPADAAAMAEFLASVSTPLAAPTAATSASGPEDLPATLFVSAASSSIATSAATATVPTARVCPAPTQPSRATVRC
jgi:mono/diheme cytochrome c family protein